MLNTFNFSKIDKLFHSPSASNLHSIYYIEFNIIKKESVKPKKTLNNNNPLKVHNKKIISLNKVFNEVNEKDFLNNNNINDNNKKVDIKDNKSNFIRKLDKRKILNQRNNKKYIENINNELYDQNKNIMTYMKESPTKIPEIFNHVYNMYNKNILLKDNENFSILFKGIIPNVFYNHLMININNKFSTGKCKYIKNSITQRNKKKLLTYIYYSPK